MFYLFDQNNSGGSFIEDDNLTIKVFIEADNIEESLDKARNIGIYFDGVNKEIDCPCCGDRWYDNPEEYKTLEDIRKDYNNYCINWASKGLPYVKIHLKNGNILNEYINEKDN